MGGKVRRAIAAGVLCVLWAEPVAAHDGYAAWKQPGSDLSCCHDRDCAPAAGWDYSLESPSGYIVKVEGTWCPVPPTALLPATTPAPPGNGHVCVLPLTLEWPGNGPPDPCQRIVCFMPGVGG